MHWGLVQPNVWSLGGSLTLTVLVYFIQLLSQAAPRENVNEIQGLVLEWGEGRAGSSPGLAWLLGFSPRPPLLEPLGIYSPGPGSRPIERVLLQAETEWSPLHVHGGRVYG